MWIFGVEPKRNLYQLSVLLGPTFGAQNRCALSLTKSASNIWSQLNTPPFSLPELLAIPLLNTEVYFPGQS